MKNGCIKKAVIEYGVSGIKPDQSFIPLLYFSQGPYNKGKAVSSSFSHCSPSKLQPSLSARTVKSSICVFHFTAEVLHCHFSSLDESSLVPLISVWNIAWKSVSQACGFDHIVSLYIFLLVPSFLLHLVLELLVRYPRIICHLSFIVKMLVCCLCNAILSHFLVMLSNSYLFVLFYILSTWEELILLNQFSALHCVMVFF